MTECQLCGGKGRYPFRVLEVQTLHIRDLGGEKRVQALGRFQSWSICQACAQARLAQSRDPKKRMLRRCVPYGLVMLVGLLLSLTLSEASEVPAIRLLGPIAMLAGLLGAASILRQERTATASLARLSPEAALEQAAWLALVEAAPKKDAERENDLSYIPLTPRTLAMDKTELMLSYDLLPAIAGKALELIHPGKNGASEAK